MFLFDVVSTARDVDAANNIVSIASNDGNSGAVGEGSAVLDGEVETVGERCGVAVGEVDGLVVDDVGLGVDVGLLLGAGDGLGVGEGPLLLTEL